MRESIEGLLAHLVSLTKPQYGFKRCTYMDLAAAEDSPAMIDWSSNTGLKSMTITLIGRNQDVQLWFVSRMIQVVPSTLRHFKLVLDSSFSERDQNICDELDWVNVPNLDKRLSLLQPSRGVAIVVHTVSQNNRWTALLQRRHLWASAIRQGLPLCTESGLLHVFSVGE